MVGIPALLTSLCLAAPPPEGILADVSCDFESGLCGWTPVDWVWHDHGIAPQGPVTGAGGSLGTAWSGTFPSACGLFDRTDADSCATLTSPFFTPGATSELRLFTWYEIEGLGGGSWWDRANVHAIGPVGHVLLTPSGGRGYDTAADSAPICHLSGEVAWAGSVGSSWAMTTFDLSPLVGTSIQIEISYNTAAIEGCEGIYVDDIVVTDLGECGDRIVDPDEACDEGGADTPACDADCTLPMCGDAHPNLPAGEACDDGNPDPADLCAADCTLTRCGDGTLQSPNGEGTGGPASDGFEACDDAGESATCDLDCTPAACGDGTINPTAGETCDDAGETATCDLDCTPAVCGDGTINPTAGETCDDAGETATCDLDCTPAACGDGTINPTAGETCDDAGETATCDLDCTPAVCGDGTINPTAGETCDDAGETATCDLDCTPAACGDGTINPTAGETCDDGNLDPADACSLACALTFCGDGTVQAPNGEGSGGPLDDGVEECDDGNSIPGDGCTDCFTEYTLAVTWRSVVAECVPDGVRVIWAVAGEDGTAGYQLMRRTAGSEPSAIGSSVRARGSYRTYQALDPEPPDEPCWYHLQEVAFEPTAGSVSWEVATRGDCAQAAASSVNGSRRNRATRRGGR